MTYKMTAEEIIQSFVGILDTPAGRRKMGEDSLLKELIEISKVYLKDIQDPITIHIFQDDEHHNGVNAKQNGQWLPHCDCFNTLLSATNYAFSLKRRLNASAVYTDWDGKEIKEISS